MSKINNYEDEYEHKSSLITSCAEIYGYELNKNNLRMYMAVIDFLPSKALEESIVMHVQSSKFFPKPSELIRLSIDNKQKEDIEPGDKIRNAVRNFGYIQKSKAKEYIGEEIWKIVESYGWSNLCYLNQKDFDFQIFRMDKYIKDVRKSSYNFLVCEKKKLLLEQKNKEIQYETRGLCNG